MSESLEDNIVGCFPLRIQNVVKAIFTDGRIGISPHKLRIRLTNTNVLQEPTDYKKSFILEVPYASKQLNWEIFFNDEDDGFPPDFEFTNDMFLSDPEPTVISKHIPTLANWNVSNPKSLLNVVREFFILYKKWQISLLEEKEIYGNFANEYKNLITKLNIAEDNIEVYLDRNTSVHFLININVNFAALPAYIQPVLVGEHNLLNPFEDSAILQISCPRSDYSRVTSNLQLSPRLEQVLGVSHSLHIPKLNKGKGLAAYVADVSKILTEKVDSICNHFKLKKEYIGALISRCPQHIVEYNNKLFTEASIWCEADSFPVVILITMGKHFPQDKPKITLRSILHMQNLKPITSIFEYPYSPRWKPSEMVDRLLNDLNTEIPRFLNNCQRIFDKDKN